MPAPREYLDVEFLRAQLLRANCPELEFCRRAKVSPTTIWRAEHGTAPRRSTFLKIAAGLAELRAVRGFEDAPALMTSRRPEKKKRSRGIVSTASEVKGRATQNLK